MLKKCELCDDEFETDDEDEDFCEDCSTVDEDDDEITDVEEA
jgi:hypothetical protein